jgi:hypothetical protein
MHIEPNQLWLLSGAEARLLSEAEAGRSHRKGGRAFRCNPSLRGFWKKPACAEFISVWQSVEHIA